MTSKEIVQRTLNGTNTSRAAQHLWVLVWAVDNYAEELKAIQRDYPDDIAYAGCNLALRPIGRGDSWSVGTSTDDFGCTYENIQRGVVGEVKHPLVDDEEWESACKVHIPEEWLSFDIAEVNKNIKDNLSDKFNIAGHCPRPFEQLQFIRGTENLYMDLMFQPTKMMEFFEKLHDFYCRLLKKWAQTDVDALQFMDDWGSQQSLLINPKLWEQIFQPMYQDFIDIAHKAGKKIFMHSDGYILDILPKLIDMGLDAVNSQLFCMGLDNLKQYKGKITFWGEIDRQHLLPKGSTKDIERAVNSVYDALYDNGHCIAQCEFGPGAKATNVREVFNSWNRLTNK